MNLSHFPLLFQILELKPNYLLLRLFHSQLKASP